MLQRTERRRCCRDNLRCRNAACAGAPKNELNYEETNLLSMDAHIYVAVPGPSAGDGLYQWNDCFHPVEEKGDRGGVNLIYKQNRVQRFYDHII